MKNLLISKLEEFLSKKIAFSEFQDWCFATIANDKEPDKKNLDKLFWEIIYFFDDENLNNQDAYKFANSTYDLILNADLNSEQKYLIFTILPYVKEGEALINKVENNLVKADAFYSWIQSHKNLSKLESLFGKMDFNEWVSLFEKLRKHDFENLKNYLEMQR